MKPCSKRRRVAVAVAPRIVALTDLEALRAAGIAYPGTEHAWRWLYRKRFERGLDSAFIRQGRRILVDVERFIELMRSPK